MSLVIPRSLLDTSMIEKIRNFLVIYPKDPWKPQTGFGFGMSEPSPPVIFYRVTSNGDFEVPYMFGIALLGRIPDVERPLGSRTFTFKGKFKEEQVDVVRKATEYLSRFGTTMLNVFPGFGKTICSSYLSSITQCLTLVLFHRSVIGTQWQGTYRDFTTARTWLVGEEPIPTDFSQIDVILSIDKRVGLIPKDILDQVGCLIIDEAHCFCTPSHVDCLLASHPKYIIGCTATLERDDEMHRMMTAMLGEQKISKISTKPFRVIKLNTGISPPVKKGFAGGINYGDLKKKLSESEERDLLIIETACNFLRKGHKIMILVALVQHAKNICGKLQQMEIKSDFMAGSKKSYSDSDVLVGSVDKVGTGFDEVMACLDYGGRRIDVGILAFSTKKEQLLEQTAGRVGRAEFPIIVHLVDDNPTIKRHWSMIKSWYVSRNGTIEEVWAKDPPGTAPIGNPRQVTQMTTGQPQGIPSNHGWTQRRIQQLNESTGASSQKNNPPNPQQTTRLVVRPQPSTQPLSQSTRDIVPKFIKT